jgi:DNA-binding XRE family transcriptional regulator
MSTQPSSGRPGEVPVTSAQIRAARGLLDWTVRDLAERSGVHRDMVSKIETGAYAGAPAIWKQSVEPSNMLASSSPTAMRQV